MARPETVLLRRSVPALHDRAFTEVPVLPQTALPSMNGSRLATTAPPQFSINQITDEVVRQLDSRLVAARERFGKI